MKLLNYNAFVQLVIALLITFSIANANQQNHKNLITPPADSAEAERVRVWVPIERHSRCLVTIDILNDSNKVIRHLVNRLLSHGYYNYYWDKRDDSGQFVKPGKYVYLLNDCGKKSYGEVTAEFKKWETESRFYPPEKKWSTKIGFELLTDSGNVSIQIYNRRDKLIDRPVVDSLMNRGRYEFEWSPAVTIPRGIYILKLIIGDFTYATEIGYNPKPR